MTPRPILTSVVTSVRLLARFRNGSVGDELDAAVDGEMDRGGGGLKGVALRARREFAVELMSTSANA